jgi:hypothetical protein
VLLFARHYWHHTGVSGNHRRYPGICLRLGLSAIDEGCGGSAIVNVAMIFFVDMSARTDITLGILFSVVVMGNAGSWLATFC